MSGRKDIGASQRGPTSARSQRWTEWMVAARDGDQSAFDSLVEEAWPAIWRRARQRIQDTALADDVTQRTFNNAWAARESFDPERANASTWIYTIADRLIIDVLEQRKGQQVRTVTGFEPLGTPTGDEGEAPGPLEPEDDVELPVAEEADDPLVAGLIRTALGQLPAADRKVLELYYFEQLSYEQIARRLGVTSQAVGPRLTRARQRLLERLPPEALP
jgi:RNA polymerase sigma-70 factor (ECF subfamily)